MARMLGHLIFLLKKRLIVNFGEEFFQELLNKADMGVRELMDQPILSGEYYDDKVYKQMLDFVMQETSKEEIIKEGELNAENEIKGIFGFIMKFISLPTVLAQVDILWKKTYSEGGVKVLNDDENNILFLIHDYEFGKAQLIGFEAYVRKSAELILKKKLKSSIRKIDNKNTELRLVPAE